MHLEAITELLNLPEVVVFQVLECTDDAIYLLVVPVDDSKPAVCSHCGRVHAAVHSRGWILVEDQPMSGRRVFLYLDKRKIRCTDGRIRVEELPWLRGRFTRRFSEQVFRLTSIVTNTEVVWFLGLDDEAVYRIDKAILQEQTDDLLLPPPAPKVMSVDEVAWKKGHSYVTNIVDIEKKAVIWNHDKHGKTVLDAFYGSLKPKECEEIKAVACDGARGFLSSTRKHALNVLIVLDHFHVKAYLSEALDTVPQARTGKGQVG